MMQTKTPSISEMAFMRLTMDTISGSKPNDTPTPIDRAVDEGPGHELD